MYLLSSRFLLCHFAIASNFMAARFALTLKRYSDKNLPCQKRL